MKRIIVYLSIATAAFLLTSAVVFATMSSTNYQIIADVFSTGGSYSSSASYSLSDTLSEAVIWSATSTSATYGIKVGFQEMYPDGFLTFSVSASSINLGTLVASAASTGSHTMAVDTNAINGFTVTVSGSTLTSGADTIDSIGAVSAASSPGSEQFGINLSAAGTAPIGSVAGVYGTAGEYAFNSGDTIASATIDINETTYTVTYLANITNATESGNYSTILTYTAIANF